MIRAALALGLSLSAAASAPPPRPVLDTTAPAELERPRWGTRIEVLGWSPAGDKALWRRVTSEPARKPRTPPTTRTLVVHRRIKAGVMRANAKSAGTDPRAWATSQGYVHEVAERMPLEEGRWWFVLETGVVELSIEVGATLTWTLLGEGAVLASGDLEAPYVAIDPSLHPAPGGRQGLLLFELSTGWALDARVEAVPL